MLNMLIIFSALIIQCILGDEDVLNTPVQFNFNSPISNFITSKNDSDIYSTHNCVIVPCVVVDKQQNCMVITKRTYGGDCYTKYIQSSLNFTSDDDVVTFEFAYFPLRQPQSDSEYTGITIGYVNEDEFVWVAAEDISLITSGIDTTDNSTNQFVTINSQAENTWSIVRVKIKPTSTKPFRIVFETFIDSTDLAGQYLITNLSIFDRGICSTNCESCLSYTECTSCSDGKLYQGVCTSDICYYDAGSITSSKVSVGWISEANYLYGIILKNIKIVECYEVTFIMNKFNYNYLNSSTPSLYIYQYGFTINANSLRTAGCQYYDQLPISNYSGYSCYFEFYLSLTNTTVVLLNLTWTQEFYYNSKDSTVSTDVSSSNVNFGELIQNVDLGTATTTVEGKILLCKDSSCRTQYQDDDDKVIYLNQLFYVLVMLDNKYIDFGTDYKFSLISATALGNGTSVYLDIQSQVEKNMSATIYGFKVYYAVQNCSISIAAQLVDRPTDDTTNSRRLLKTKTLRLLADSDTTTDSTTSTSSSGYSVSGKITIKSFEILPGWIIYSAKDVPYIIIGAVVALVLFLFGCYCFFIGKSSNGPNQHNANNQDQTELAPEIINQAEIDRLRNHFVQ